ncbi:MAG: RrF2 family transcriptional regulator [Syntrophomonadaceae bacterium]|nr:RrF2 family transcriptional regulator [Syntrophomonadaceae bacterium]
MKLSTKGRYGLRSMLDLAIYSNGDHVSLNSIAERQDISPNYLEQVFSTLRKAGLVNSVKGAQGGYILADSPSRITVGNILRALEGKLSITGEHNDIEAKNQIEYCLKTNVWDAINNSINTVVDSITLEDLVVEYKKLSGNLSNMFYI